MRVLFFHATAGHPSVVRALMDQAANTLRPFNRFLGQAIHTAKQRQFRYQLPWERVRDLITINLEPTDSLLRVPRRLPGVILADWPADKVPDRSLRGFVTNRHEPVIVEVATPTTQGIMVYTDPPLRPDDRLFWCGIECTVRQEEAPPPPSTITDHHGRALKLVGSPRENGDRHWVLLIEGKHGDCDLHVDGEAVEAEALPVSEDLRRVVDSQERSFEVSGGMLRVEELPSEGLLRGNNGVRYRWVEKGSAGRRGNWLQLLPPEALDAEEFLDPRAAFCEGDATEVWTQARHSPSTTYKVKRVDQDRYQLLLDRYPPEDSTLYLPVDLRNLHLQRRALRQLTEAPLPHHQGLLRLCEDPNHVRWPAVKAILIRNDGWRALTDESRSGTTEQRGFVGKALGSPDFAFLEGPPGSGKTTAICEIIQQLVEQGQRVLLCASTHVAIDNVLERLLASSSPIDAVRIGKIDKVDDNVQVTQIDSRVEALVSSWRGLPEMKNYGTRELEQMAERTVIMAANLTCGTTMGIVNHPLFRGRDEDLHVSERPITTMPHWDVLIVDEASKTLIQEFLVPALMAKRWIIVGDVRQLPPFADRADLIANLRDLVDEQDKPLFPPDHQRACLLLFRLLRSQIRKQGLRWLLVEPPGVLECIARELRAKPPENLSVVRITAKGSPSLGSVSVITIAQLREGGPQVLRLAAADWVLVGNDLISEISGILPSNLLLARDLSSGSGATLHEGDALLTRQAWWLARSGRLRSPYQERKFRREEIETMADCQACETDWLSRNDLATEITWRLTRLHELRYSHNERQREKLHRELGVLQPFAVNIQESLDEISDIGLPSILEVLQEGIGVERANRQSALTAGFRAKSPQDFKARFDSLSFQHRMHPDIASFSRDIIYEGQALRDANTIAWRDKTLGWDFGAFPARRVWAHVEGREISGENQDEVSVIAGILRDFIGWARRKGLPARSAPRVWEVACLCFYVKQERALSEMLRRVTQDDRKTRFQVRDAPVEIVCGTVDRFQGREADLVMLSMRNTGRTGFLDSPNRLNVAVTRARQQLVVVGNIKYFEKCKIDELEALATRTRQTDEKDVRQWRRSTP